MSIAESSADAQIGLPSNKRSAKRISASYEDLSECAQRLRAGDLVSFPTETVYVSPKSGGSFFKINFMIRAKEIFDFRV